MKAGRGCELVVLAEELGCRVERCSHGVIHLTIGGMTLRLEPRKFEVIARTVCAAQSRAGHGDPSAEVC